MKIGITGAEGTIGSVLRRGLSNKYEIISFTLQTQDFESVQMRCRQKLDLTFSIRRLRNRGKNEFEALDEMKRSVFLDFEKYASTMIEKRRFVFKKSILLPGFAFLQPGLSRF